MLQEDPKLAKLKKLKETSATPSVVAPTVVSEGDDKLEKLKKLKELKDKRTQPTEPKAERWSEKYNVPPFVAAPLDFIEGLGKMGVSTLMDQVPSAAATFAANEIETDYDKYLMKLSGKATGSRGAGFSGTLTPEESQELSVSIQPNFKDSPEYFTRKEEFEKKQLKNITSALKYAAEQRAEMQASTEGMVTSTSDIKSVEDFSSWLGQATGQALGQIIPSLVTGGGSSYLMEAAEVLERATEQKAEELGIDPVDVVAQGLVDKETAQIYGGVAASLELASNVVAVSTMGGSKILKALVLRNLGKKGRSEAAEGLAKKLAKEATESIPKKLATASATEFVTEGSQSRLEQVGGREAAGEEGVKLFSPTDEEFEEIKESALAGGAGALMLGAAGNISTTTNKQKELATKLDAVAQETTAAVAPELEQDEQLQALNAQINATVQSINKAKQEEATATAVKSEIENAASTTKDVSEAPNVIEDLTIEAAPTNVKELAKVNEDLFGLEPPKAKAAASIMDRILRTISNRVQKPLDEIYSNIKFKKPNKEETDRLIEQSKDNLKFQLIGPEGLKNLGEEGRIQQAEQLEQQGATSDEIWQATKLERSNDGSWFGEISSKDAKVLSKDEILNLVKQSKPNKYGYRQPVPLTSVIDYPALFKAYPKLKDVKFIATTDDQLKGSFAYSEEFNGIFADERLLAKLDNEQVLGTLLHELFHGQQKIEPTFTEQGTTPKRVDELLDVAVGEGFKLPANFPVDPTTGYKRAMGEVNARNTAMRSVYERKISDIYQTQYKFSKERADKLASEQLAKLKPSETEYSISFEDLSETDRTKATQDLKRMSPFRLDRVEQLPISRIEELVRQGAKEYAEKAIQPVLFQTEAFHGSPYLFDAFQERFMGKGEGLQTYAHGFYFTTSKELSKFYADKGFLRRFYKDYVREFPVLDKIYSFEMTVDEFIEKAVTPQERQQAQKLKAKLEKDKVGRVIYRTLLHKGKTPDEYQYLKWESSVPSKVLDKITAQLPDLNVDNISTAKDLYNLLSSKLGTPKAASDFLLKIGVDGIEYKTPSKKADSADINFVVFDPNSVSMEEVIKYQNAKGAIQALGQQQAVIYALTNPDVSTPLHELAHYYEQFLTDEERGAVLEWAGTDEWTTETSELFARGFEKFLSDGIAPNKRLENLFIKFREWLLKLYNGITDSAIDIGLNPEMQAIYSVMLGASADKYLPFTKLTEAERKESARLRLEQLQVKKKAEKEAAKPAPAKPAKEPVKAVVVKRTKKAGASPAPVTEPTAKQVEKVSKAAEQAEARRFDKFVQAQSELGNILRDPKYSSKERRLEKYLDKYADSFESFESFVENTSDRLKSRAEKALAKLQKFKEEEEFDRSVPEELQPTDEEIASLESDFDMNLGLDDDSDDIKFQLDESEKKDESKVITKIVNQLARYLEFEDSVQSLEDVGNFIANLNNPNVTQLYTERVTKALRKVREKGEQVRKLKSKVAQRAKNSNHYKTSALHRRYVDRVLALDYKDIQPRLRKKYRSALAALALDKPVSPDIYKQAIKKEVTKKIDELKTVDKDLLKRTNTGKFFDLATAAKNPALIATEIGRFKKQTSNTVLKVFYGDVMESNAQVQIKARNIKEKLQKVSRDNKLVVDDHTYSGMFGVARRVSKAEKDKYAAVKANAEQIVKNSANKIQAIKDGTYTSQSAKEAQRELELAEKLYTAIDKAGTIEKVDSDILSKGQKELYDAVRSVIKESEADMLNNIISIWGQPLDLETIDENYIPTYSLGSLTQGEIDNQSELIINNNANSVWSALNASNNYGKILAQRSGFARLRTQPKSHFYDYNLLSLASRWSYSGLSDLYNSSLVKELDKLLINNREVSQILKPKNVEVLVESLKNVFSAGRRADKDFSKAFKEVASVLDSFTLTAMATSGQLLNQMGSAVPAALLISPKGFTKAIAAMTGIERGDLDSKQFSQWLDENGMGIQVRDFLFDKFNNLEDLNLPALERKSRRIKDTIDEFNTGVLKSTDKAAARLVWFSAYFAAGGTLEKPSKAAALEAERQTSLLQNMSDLTFAPALFRNNSTGMRILSKIFLAFKSFAINSMLTTWAASGEIIRSKGTNSQAWKVFAQNVAMSMAYTAISKYVIAEIYGTASTKLAEAIGLEPEPEDDDEDKTYSVLQDLSWNALLDIYFGGLPHIADEMISYGFNTKVAPYIFDDKDPDDFDRMLDSPIYSQKDMKDVLAKGWGPVGDAATTFAETGGTLVEGLIREAEGEDFGDVENEEKFWVDMWGRYIPAMLAVNPYLPLKGDIVKTMRGVRSQYNRDKAQETRDNKSNSGKVMDTKRVNRIRNANRRTPIPVR